MENKYCIKLEVHWPMASSGVNLTAKSYAEAHRISRAYVLSLTDPLMVLVNITSEQQKRVISGPPDHVIERLTQLQH